VTDRATAFVEIHSVASRGGLQEVLLHQVVDESAQSASSGEESGPLLDVDERRADLLLPGPEDLMRDVEFPLVLVSDLAALQLAKGPEVRPLGLCREVGHIHQPARLRRSADSQGVETAKGPEDGRKAVAQEQGRLRRLFVGVDNQGQGRKLGRREEVRLDVVADKHLADQIAERGRASLRGQHGCFDLGFRSFDFKRPFRMEMEFTVAALLGGCPGSSKVDLLLVSDRLRTQCYGGAFGLALLGDLRCISRATITRRRDRNGRRYAALAATPAPRRAMAGGFRL
jgi:hypothetical protein